MGENVLVNMSVWRDVASLSNFVYKTAHVEIMRRRRPQCQDAGLAPKP
jgi:hypothetical protein